MRFTVDFPFANYIINTETIAISTIKHSASEIGGNNG